MNNWIEIIKATIEVKISVITVSFNSESTIGDAIRSVASQRHTDIEHLVIDGKSTDGTEEIVEAYRHQRLVFCSAPDDGIYDAMNKGLKRASGEVIGFLNSDDLFADPDALTWIAKSFDDNPSVEACFGDLVYVSQDNRRVVRYWKSRSFERGLFARGWSPAHPTFYIRRSALNRLGFFDLSYRLAADAEFMMRYLERGGVSSAYLPHVLVRMRVGGATNRSWRNIVMQNQEIFRALKSNALPHSPFHFVLHKIASRLNQRLSGFMIGDAQ